MKVLKRGLDKSERLHRATCNACDSELEFKQKEATYVSDQRHGDFLRVICPVCGADVCKSL